MPRIKTTRTVRVALWALRIYLVLLLALIAVKFARVLASHGRHLGAGGTTVQPGPNLEPRQDAH
jgi:hypothetical protein